MSEYLERAYASNKHAIEGRHAPNREIAQVASLRLLNHQPPMIDFSAITTVPSHPLWGSVPLELGAVVGRLSI